MSTTPAIHTTNLTRDFANVRAVDQLSITVPQGIIFGFLGPNGSGKTTTIRILLGLLDASAGSGEVLGFDIQNQGEDVRAISGALLEHNGLYERLTAEENLDFFGKIWRMPAFDRKKRVQQLLEHIGLWDRRHERIGVWSRGMKQKLAVARTLLHHPKIVFMDEPTSGLDPVAAASLRDDLVSLSANEGVTIFLNTHNLAEAERVCDLVGVIHHGRLIAFDHPDALRKSKIKLSLEIAARKFDEHFLDRLASHPDVLSIDKMNEYLKLNLQDGSDTAALVSYITSLGAEIEEIRKGKADLEEIFLKLLEDNQEKNT